MEKKNMDDAFVDATKAGLSGATTGAGLSIAVTGGTLVSVFTGSAFAIAGGLACAKTLDLFPSLDD